jgi:hypothetical protein
VIEVQGPLGNPPFEKPSIQKIIKNFVVMKYDKLRENNEAEFKVITEVARTFLNCYSELILEKVWGLVRFFLEVAATQVLPKSRGYSGSAWKSRLLRFCLEVAATQVLPGNRGYSGSAWKSRLLRFCLKVAATQVLPGNRGYSGSSWKLRLLRFCLEVAATQVLPGSRQISENPSRSTF